MMNIANSLDEKSIGYAACPAFTSQDAMQHGGEKKPTNSTSGLPNIQGRFGPNRPWRARSSAVERSVHIGNVGSSILSVPTISPSPSPSPAIVTAYKRRVPFRLHPARFGLKCTNCGCDLDNQAAERRAAGNASVLPSPSIGRART